MNIINPTRKPVTIDPVDMMIMGFTKDIVNTMLIEESYRVDDILLLMDDSISHKNLYMEKAHELAWAIVNYHIDWKRKELEKHEMSKVPPNLKIT